LTPVKFDGLYQTFCSSQAASDVRSVLQNSFKLGHICLDTARVQANGGSVSHKDSSGEHPRGLQLAAERGERHPQLVAGHVPVILRPEGFDQLVTEMSGLPVVSKIGE